MTAVSEAVKKGRGRILASYREIPIVCLEKVKEISKILMRKEMGGILVICSPNKPVIGIPPGIDRVGIVVAGGLNPIAALQESGIETESTAMSTLYPYAELTNFKELL